MCGARDGSTFSARSLSTPLEDDADTAHADADAAAGTHVTCAVSARRMPELIAGRLSAQPGGFLKSAGSRRCVRFDTTCGVKRMWSQRVHLAALLCAMVDLPLVGAFPEWPGIAPYSSRWKYKQKCNGNEVGFDSLAHTWFCGASTVAPPLVTCNTTPSGDR